MAFPPAYNHPYHQQHQQHQVPHFSTTFAPHESRFSQQQQQPVAPLGASPPGQMDTSTNYLPAYLLGGSPRSPTRQQRHSPYYPRGHHSHRTSDINMSRGVSVRASPYSTEGSVRKLDKPVGPPIQSLYDHTSSPVQSSTPLMLRTSPERRHLNFSGMTTVNRFSGTTPDLHRMTPSRGTDHTTLSTPPYSAIGSNHQVSPPSPPQLDPFYSQGESLSSDDRLDECWITIFGFPSSASAYILDQFSQYGTILRHEVVAEGNWMHIQYQTRIEAKKALSKNGKVFGSGVMVGVQQCVDKAVMSGGGATTTSTATPVAHVLPKQTTIRPLTAAYQAASSGHELAPSNPNTPQKSTGIFSRAMEYMFGW